MISGTVSAALEAVVQLDVIGPRGQSLKIEFVVDTGFTGYLLLQPVQVAALGLPWLRREVGVLADGAAQLFDVYEAEVFTDVGPQLVEVPAAGAQPLLGMRLLRGHDLALRVVVGGAVRITAIP